MYFCKWIPKAENSTENIFWFRYFKTTVTTRPEGSKQLELGTGTMYNVFSAEDEPGFVSHILGLLHMSPVSEPYLSCFVKFLMISLFERVGWLGSRDLGFSNRGLQ